MTLHRMVRAVVVVLLLGGGVALLASPAHADTGESCVRSRLTYVDTAVKPAIGWSVSLLGVPPSGTPAPLASVATDVNGWFTACFQNATAPDWSPGFHKLRVVYRTESALMRFLATTSDTDAAAEEVVHHDVDFPNVPIGGTPTAPQPLTATQLSSTHALQPAAKAYAMMVKTYVWMHSDSTHPCWDVNEAPGVPCQIYTVKWFRNSAVWLPASATSFYFPDPQNPDQSITTKRRVMLAPGDAARDDVVGHELGHYLMHDLYGFFPLGLPEFPICVQVPHYLNRQIGWPATMETPAQIASAKKCAFAEGFAHWVSSMVRNSKTSGTSNLESPPAPPAWDAGDLVEGRIAAALIDLSDTGTEGCDTWSDTTIAPAIGPWEGGVTLAAASLLRPQTWAEYVSARAALGHPVPLGLQKQNTLAPGSGC
jgi:hypothetical protein